MCLLCDCFVSNGAVKPRSLKEHLTMVHPERSRENVAYFRKLRDKIMSRRTLRSNFTDDCKVWQTTQSGSSCWFHWSRSKDTEQRRIDEMAMEVEEPLCDLLRRTEFALKLDESTLPGNEALLLACVRFMKDEQLTQEFLFAREFSTDTKGESIFRVFEHFFKQKAIPLKNIIAVATDGAASMVGCYRGFVSYLKQVVPEVMTVHCVIHRQHLAAKHLSPRLNESLHNCVMKRTRNITDFYYIPKFGGYPEVLA
uniref:DUF4371 domain-containing protein n=1 Tax=Trichuris muris TaxID=70415 RepID=A0A5S6Q3Z3_TRIMR